MRRAHTAAMRDTWRAADAYERYIGRWSRLVAREFVAKLPLPADSLWIDVGCGSGAVTSAIVDLRSPVRVVSVDRSVEFVAQFAVVAEHRNARFLAADAIALPFGDGVAAAVASGLVLNFVAQPQMAVREMVRCLRPGGVVAVYVWDYGEGMELIRNFWRAATDLDAGAAALDEANRFPLCQPVALESLFRDAGLSDVAIESVTIPTVFENFADLWAPFLGGQGPAPSYVMALPDEKRMALRNRLAELVPARADGSIALTARAWVAIGTKDVA